MGRLLLRATVGGFFIGHGTQKLFGWFGGHGLAATSEGFENLGLHPGHVHATAAGAAESGGGVAMLLGLQVPFAAAGLIATMLTAINRVHFKNGPWAGNGGYEYNAVMIAAAATLAEVGPGPISLDALRGKERKGLGWSVAAIAGGVAGAVGAHLFAESQKPAIAPAAEAAAAEARSANGSQAVGDESTVSAS